ncbi:MAG: hypothetical protein FGM32_09780 [Candidatus Kapabacteria bacterium]|nr:hypothetical protein [Candidatus Kapabacteria bacterium]
MISSARILAQRYLEGDLNDLEREAFLEDVERDPRVAEILEQEAQVDLAIIDDAFTIEPPSHLRAAVLSSIATTHTHGISHLFVPMVRQIIIGLVFLVSSVARIDMSNGLNRISATSTSEMTLRSHTTAAIPAVEKRVLRASSPASESLAEPPVIQADIEEVVIQPVSSRGNDRASIRSLASPAFMPMIAEPPATIALPSLGQVSGLVGGAGASFRYELLSSDNAHLFVESGILSAPLQSSVFVNGISQISPQQALLPFAAVGAEGTLAYVSMLDREIRGSIAIGMAATGPLAIADVSTSLVQLGPTSFNAGLRFFGAYELRGQTTIMQLQPIVGITMGL